MVTDKKKTLFLPAKNKYLADLIIFTDKKKARESTYKLLEQFRYAKTDTKRNRIIHAVDLAEKRAIASQNRSNLSDEVRSRMKYIAMIYGGLLTELRGHMKDVEIARKKMNTDCKKGVCPI